MKPTKKMVEVWIEQHTLRVTRAYIIDVRDTYKGKFDYHMGNGDVVIGVDGDDILEGAKEAVKFYKSHLKELKKAFA